MGSHFHVLLEWRVYSTGKYVLFKYGPLDTEMIILMAIYPREITACSLRCSEYSKIIPMSINRDLPK